METNYEVLGPLDAEALFGYVMLLRVQAYLFTVAAYEAVEVVSEHRYHQFAKVFSLEDLTRAQEIESHLNRHVTQVYVNATSHEEWTRLTRDADLRSMMNARYLRSTLQ
jgi:hypothetical protein